MPEETKQEPVFCIILASRQIRNFFSQKLRPYNIGLEQMSVMVMLQKKGPLNLTDLSGVLLKDKGTISRTVESLCKKNFVKKIHEKTDNRCIKIIITEEGRKKLTVVQRNKEKIVDVFSKSLSEDEKREFCRILGKITESVK